MNIKLSKGMQQKVLIIQSLIHNADLYIFDEPLSGLDDQTKERFVNEIKKLRKNSKLIVISTHSLKEYRLRVKNVIEMGDRK